MTVNILVSDPSVLIDLDRGCQLETTFGLAFEFASPDLLYHQELAQHGGPAQIELGLRVEALDGDGVALALRYRHAHRPSLYPIASPLRWPGSIPGYCSPAIVNSANGRQANTSPATESLGSSTGFPKRGLLSSFKPFTSVAAIAAHPRCRLPEPELRKRLQRFADG